MTTQNFLYCAATAIKFYANDVIQISTCPDTKFILRVGWYHISNAQKWGWYLINIADKSVIPIESVDLATLTKVPEHGGAESPAIILDMDAESAKSGFIVIPGTNIRLYDSDIIKISNYPHTLWVVHMGWYVYNGAQNFGWYVESLESGEILPIAVINLTLCTLVSVKTQGSEMYDGKVVNYTKPFTEADATILNRTFLTLDTIKQRDNLDNQKLVDGRLVRINNVGGESRYYAWDANTHTWDLIDFGGDGAPTKTVYLTETMGTSSDPYYMRYSIYQGGEGSASTPDPAELLANIDIPKDMVVESGSVVEIFFDDSDDTLHEGSISGPDVTTAIKGSTTPTSADAGKYIKLIIANTASTAIYIKVTDLVDLYTGGSSTYIDVTISNSNVITATLNATAVALLNKADTALQPEALAPAYNPAATYALGDYVTHGGKLQECTTAITTPEAWNPTHWRESTVIEAYQPISSAYISGLFT